MKTVKGASKNSNFFVAVFCSAPTVGARGENSIHAVLAISVTVRRPGDPASRRFGDPKHRTDDCMDAAAGAPAVRRSEARAMPGAIAENRSVHKVHEDRWGGPPSGWRTSTELTPQSRKKCIFRSALKTFLLAVSALLLLNTTQLQALSTDSRQQIEVEADSLEIRENDNISVYQGNVRLLQGSMQIDSDHMVIHFNDEGELESMVMTGSPARFRQLDDQNQQMLGQARKINYLESENILELIDEARFDRAGDVIESSLIRINTKTNGIAAGSDDPDQRVKVLIQPKLKN